MRKLDTEKTPKEEARLRENKAWITPDLHCWHKREPKKDQHREELGMKYMYCFSIVNKWPQPSWLKTTHTYYLGVSVDQGSRLFSWVLSSESHKSTIVVSVKVHSHLEAWLGKNPSPSISNCWKIHFLVGIELMQLASSRPSGKYLWPPGEPQFPPWGVPTD